MTTPLSVQDPLTNQQVIIVITAVPQDVPCEERPILLSLGVASSAPTTRNGRLGDVFSLLQSAWAEFGRRETQAVKTAEPIPTAEPVTLVTTPVMTPPKPKLSLF